MTKLDVRALTATCPEATATRTGKSRCSSSPSSAAYWRVPRTMAEAADTAVAAADSPCASTPKTATTASPMNFSTLPPCRSTSEPTRLK